ncbi:MAG: aminoglycoside phosphotransferase [Sulfurovum sp. FS06-10]|nr:MAG: aminoglycoside phosphotransferase [Sulfurovum sp. FS06-10]
MQEIKAWIDTLGYKNYTLEVISADASFRNYYRLVLEDATLVVMDASAQRASLIPFLDVSRRLLKARLTIPRIIFKNLDEGFLLLEDLGSIHLADLLNEQSFHLLYMKAICEIVKMQKAEVKGLEPYDEAFLRLEMDLMKAWYVEKHLEKDLTKEAQEILETTLSLITKEVLSQPQNVLVHRDFHSRNIMLLGGKLIPIDYQDARVGAITYDLVSLLKDVYVEFDAKKIEVLALEFKRSKGIKVSDELFIRWFDFMGLQRHIKILGIFARLNIRDGKRGYLKHIPLTRKYIKQVCSKYKELEPFMQLLEKELL